MAVIKYPDKSKCYFPYNTLKQTGNILELRSMTKEPKSNIKKLNKNQFVVVGTGEIKEFDKSALTRMDNIESVSKSFKKLRDIINTNVLSPENCLFVTLTYKENMKDCKKLYNDFRKFNERLKTYCNKNNVGDYEYICVAEPQARGAWHCHVIYIFKRKRVFIANDRLQKIWGHGFVKVKKISNNIDNIGVYLTSYLTDVAVEDIQDYKILNDISDKDIKEVVITSDEGNNVSKRFVKGLRMKMYPKGMRIYRCSSGIISPTITKCSYTEAESIIKKSTLTYEKTICIQDENDTTVNVIRYKYFNNNKIKKGDESDE